MNFIVIAVIMLVGAGLLYWLWHRSQYSYELVELDENDPEYKRLVESRNSLLNSIFEHIAINLNIAIEEINETCEIINLDAKRTIVKFASNDIICTLVLHWDKFVKIVLFSNRKMRGKIVQRKKIFLIKDNSLALDRLTKFVIKFRKKTYGEKKVKTDDIEAACLQVAKDIAEKTDEKDLKAKFLAAVINSSLDDYKKPVDGAELYTFTYAFLMKFYEKELLEALTPEENDEKEPE